MTQNLEQRINEHNQGKTQSTKHWRPWILFFIETFDSRQEARLREKYLKSGFGKKWIKEKWAREMGPS
jgi:putative endonuclease